MSEIEDGKTYYVAVKAWGGRGDGNIGVRYKNFNNTPCYPTFRPDQLIDPKVAQPEWQPILEAPKDGTEMWVWREDYGPVLARWIAMCDFLNADSERGEHVSCDEWEEADWFYADFIHGGRLDFVPTHFQLTPEPPKQ